MPERQGQTKRSLIHASHCQPGLIPHPLQFQFHPPFSLKLRENFQWWINAKASKEVQQLILEGIKLDYPIMGKLSMKTCIRTKEETKLALETIQEYLEVGAMKEIPRHNAKHLIHFFPGVIVSQGGFLHGPKTPARHEGSPCVDAPPPPNTLHPSTKDGKNAFGRQ